MANAALDWAVRWAMTIHHTGAARRGRRRVASEPRAALATARAEG